MLENQSQIVIPNLNKSGRSRILLIWRRWNIISRKYKMQNSAWMQEKCAIWECSRKMGPLEPELKFNSAGARKWLRRIPKNLAVKQSGFTARSCLFTQNKMSPKNGGNTFLEAVQLFSPSSFWSKITSTGPSTTRCFLLMVGRSQVQQMYLRLVEW
jgi:hypothetical protein